MFFHRVETDGPNVLCLKLCNICANSRVVNAEALQVLQYLLQQFLPRDTMLARYVAYGPVSVCHKSVLY